MTAKLSRRASRVIDSEGALRTHMDCVQCGYDLHKQLITCECPECGAPVRRSVDRGEFFSALRTSFRSVHVDEQPDPEVLLLRWSSLVPTCLGVFLTFFGAVFLLSAAAGWTAGSAGHRSFAPFFAIMGAALLLSGVYLAVGRAGLKLDRHQKTVTKWTRTLGMQHEGVQRTISACDRVLLEQYGLFNRMHNPEQIDRYRLLLQGEHNNATEIEIVRALSQIEAQDLAQRISAFLDLPIVERVGPPEGIPPASGS